MLVLTNFHRFLSSPEIVQALAQQITVGKANRTFVIVLSPLVQVPVELEKLFVVIEHDLPSREQLEEIARGIATEDGELPEGDKLGTVLDAACGLTRFEAEGAFSLSLVRHGHLAADSIWDLKSQTLKKSGLLQLYRGSERFDSLGGLQAMKAFCLRSMRRQGHANPLKRPKGVMLLSPPGCGKSQFAKCLGSEANRPTLILDIGSLMGSLVGSTEANIRQALKIIDAMSPCVVMVDEVEKALAGVASSGSTDSGVTARLFGTFLTWLNDRTSDSYVICTCNDISKLPPEFSRSERFDGIWFLDLPGREQKDAIWDIYLKMFELDAGPGPAQGRPVDGRGSESLLPTGGAVGLAADGGGPERRARGGHGGRERRAAAAVGVGAVPRCRRRRHLSRRWCGLRLEAGPQGAAAGPVEQLMLWRQAVWQQAACPFSTFISRTINMPDLKDGESAQVQGSARAPYTLKNVGGVYSCTCPAWRNQSLPIERRTCKHLRAFRGEQMERERLGSLAPATIAKTKDATVTVPSCSWPIRGTTTRT